jgi:hypothetical protein
MLRRIAAFFVIGQSSRFQSEMEKVYTRFGMWGLVAAANVRFS